MRGPIDPSSGLVAALNALGMLRALAVVTAMVLSVFWAALAVVFGILPVGPGLINRLGGIAAGDFMFFYASGVVAADGRAGDVYNPAALTAAGRHSLGPVPELVWPYPPTLSLPLAGLGHLPPGIALSVWIGLGIASILLTARLAFGSWRYAPVALLFPASAFALFAGQLSPFLALMLGTLILRGRTQPWLAGPALGLLAWKPHLAIAPALLLGRVKTVAIGAATVLLLTLLSVAVFGVEPWRTFLTGGVRHASSIVAETPQARFVTNFSAAYTYGLPVGLAYLVHALLAPVGCWIGFWLWRSDSLDGVKAFGLVAATFQLTPYALDYDLVLFLLPWLLLIRDACAHPHAARRLFWPWLFLTVLLPTSYLLSIYTVRSHVGPLILVALIVLVASQSRSTRFRWTRR